MIGLTQGFQGQSPGYWTHLEISRFNIKQSKSYNFA